MYIYVYVLAVTHQFINMLSRFRPVVLSSIVHISPLVHRSNGISAVRLHLHRFHATTAVLDEQPTSTFTKPAKTSHNHVDVSSTSRQQGKEPNHPQFQQHSCVPFNPVPTH
jgi:hypothetical protein